MTVDLPIAVAMFLLAAVVIVVAATFLTTSADIIASRMRLGRLWVGSLLLAGATSLPELATAVAAALAGSAELAAGNMFGANMLNMSNLAILLALFGGRQVFQRLAPQQWLVAASAIAVTGIATLFAALRTDVTWLAVSIPGVVILVIYLVLSGVLRQYSKGIEEQSEEEEPSHSLRWAWMVFIVCAGAIFVSGPLLAFSAQRIADLTGIGASFMGVLALALVTTLPELTTTYTAFRIGAHDMAVANMYGTNSFNIAALAVADLSFSGGSLFGSVDISTVCAGLIATLLMSLGMLQILRRRPMKLFSLTEPSPPLIVGLYVLGLSVVFQLA
ncbi:hypothetical protein FIM08_00880 [SAR202 cluster bacterium AC-647-N09_OGT_505m]|nr:hypothetical protein [SAR202 cluster bacterium AC-647-N09_OGT_505m]